MLLTRWGDMLLRWLPSCSPLISYGCIHSSSVIDHPIDSMLFMFHDPCCMTRAHDVGFGVCEGDGLACINRNWHASTYKPEITTSLFIPG